MTELDNGLERYIILCILYIGLERYASMCILEHVLLSKLWYSDVKNSVLG